MKFYLDEALELNKEIIKVVDRIKVSIDRDFPEFPSPEEVEDELVFVFYLSEEHTVACSVDLAENTGENLSRVAGYIIALMDKGQRIADHYQARLDIAETAGDSHKADILTGKADEGRTIAAIAKSKRLTATEMKAAAAGDSTTQIYNSTVAMYKAGLQHLKGRLKSYDRLLFAISDEIRRRSKGFKD